MSVDRAELAGTGAAIAIHAALIAALSLSLARVSRPPEPPAMEVELVDSVGLQSAAPAPVVAPPPPSEAPELRPAETAPPPPVPAPQVVPAPAPPPPVAAIAPAPARRTPPPPAKPTPPRPARIGADFLKGLPQPPAAPRIGADFLKGVPNAPTASARSSAPAISASAMAGIIQAIKRQVQPCANRQSIAGEGINRIKVRLHLVLDRSGRLSRPPQVLEPTTGLDDDNRRYEDRVKDAAIAIIGGCAPLVGLPPDLYKTANGQGWGDFVMTYQLP